MPQFPIFRNPQTPGGIQAFGLNQKMLDISPLLTSVQQENARRPSRPKGVGTKDRKEDLLQGRIGAVNQYYQAVNTATSDISRMENIWGELATLMPEYSDAKQRLEYYTSPEFQNIIAEETKDVESYEKITKESNGGEMYHLGEFMRTNGGNTAKHSELIKQQNLGYTKGLPFTLGGKQKTAEGLSDPLGYDRSLDLNPNFSSMQDAQDEMDQIYNPANNQFQEKAVSSLTSAIIAGAGFDVKGIQKFKRKTGNDLAALGFAEGEATERLKNGQYDITDPLVAGYLQGFLQKTEGGTGTYGGKEMRKPNGEIDQAVFGEAFKTFVQTDITSHYKKRITMLETEDRTINEQSNYAYTAGAGNKDVLEVLAGGTTKEATIIIKDKEDFKVGSTPEYITEVQAIANKYGLGDVVTGENAMFEKIIDADGKEKTVVKYGSRYKSAAEGGDVDPDNPFTKSINNINAMTELPVGYVQGKFTGTLAPMKGSTEYDQYLREYKAEALTDIAMLAKDMYNRHDLTTTKEVNGLNSYNETTYNMTMGVTDKINKSFGKGDKETHYLFNNTSVSFSPGSQSDGGQVLQGTKFLGVHGTTTMKLRYMPTNWTMNNDGTGYFRTSNGEATNKAGYTSSKNNGFLLRPHSEASIDAQNAWNAKNPDNPDISGTIVAGYFQEGTAKVTNPKVWFQKFRNAKMYTPKKTFDPKTVEDNTELITNVLKSLKPKSKSVTIGTIGSVAIAGAGPGPIDVLTDKEYSKKYGVSKLEARKIIELAKIENNNITKTVTSYIKGRYIEQGLDPTKHQRHVERKNILKDQSIDYNTLLSHVEAGTLNQIMDKSTASYMNFKVEEEDKNKFLTFTFQADITRMYDQAGVKNKKTKGTFLERQVNHSNQMGTIDFNDPTQNAAIDNKINKYF